MISPRKVQVHTTGLALLYLLRPQQAVNHVQVVRVGAEQVHGFPSEAAFPRHLHHNYLPGTRYEYISGIDLRKKNSCMLFVS